MRQANQFIAVLALATAVPGAGQSIPLADAAPDGTIVVTGKAEPAPKDVYHQALGITRINPYKLYEQALPRFAAPLCPGVLGPSNDSAAAAMADRMRADVSRVRLRLARPGCSPNLLVAFVDKGQSTLAELQSHRPDLFSALPGDERQELLSTDAPAHVWNNISVRWTGAGPPPRGWPREKASVWGQLDRTSMPEAYDIRSTLVLFDREAVVGMTITQLADYATMRGLSHTRPPSGDQPTATILSLFSKSKPQPAEMTPFDVSYLRGLYSEASNRSAVSKLLAARREAEREHATN